jgi:hypothetical protein
LRALWSLYLAVTRSLGARRRFIRRIAALCLVVLGVHHAADAIDDVVFRIIDWLDLGLDNLVWAILDALSPPDEAALYATRFSEWVDLDEKDKAAKVLALGVELVVDVWLLDLVWGRRGARADGHGLLDELKASTRELRSALWPLDLERLAGPPTILFFALAGALWGAVALEEELNQVVTELAPQWRWAPNAAAAAAILVSAVLLWRFLPDLLEGAILRAHQRADRAKQRREAAPAPATKVAVARAWLRSVTRGALLALIVLPIAVLGLLEQGDVLALVARLGTNL